MHIYRNTDGQFLQLTQYSTHTGQHIDVAWVPLARQASVGVRASLAHRKNIDLSTLEVVPVRDVASRIETTPISNVLDIIDAMPDTPVKHGVQGAVAGLVSQWQLAGNSSELYQKLNEVRETLRGIQALQDALLSSFDIAGDGQSLLPAVDAEIHSDDFTKKVEFNAALWLKSASLEEILELASDDWGGDYSADVVGYFFEPKIAEISEIFSYLHGSSKRKDGMGFEVNVNGDQALAWLMAHRVDAGLEVWAANSDNNVNVIEKGNESAPWFYELCGKQSAFGFTSRTDALRAAWLQPG